MYPLIQTNWKKVLTPLEVRALTWLNEGPMWKSGNHWVHSGKAHRVGFQLCEKLKTKGLLYENGVIKLSPKGESVLEIMQKGYQDGDENRAD